MKIEFSSQRREMLLFLTISMATLTSRANQQCNGSFLLQASKPGLIVVALILLSEIISHMLNKI